MSTVVDQSALTAGGAVALGMKTNAPSLWRRCSDGMGEFGEDRLEPAAGLGIEAEVVVSTAQVLTRIRE